MSKQIKLNNLSTNPPSGTLKEKYKKEMTELIVELSDLQDKLYAQNKYSVLIIIQGMDTSGKDSAVKHVFSGVNPAGCNVKSFKAPTTEEKNHHYLWRINKCSPSSGMIQIFNRSQYEDIIMPTLAKSLNEKEITQRYNEIESFEMVLVESNTILIKCYLHISYEEQLLRLESRKTTPNKKWKYQSADAIDIGKHEAYRKIYDQILSNSNKSAKWEIIPADKKWFKNHAILKHIIHRLKSYKIDYPNQLKTSE